MILENSDERCSLARQVRCCEQRWFQETREQATAGDLASMLLAAEMLCHSYGCPHSRYERFREALHFLRLYLVRRYGTANLLQLEVLAQSGASADETLPRALFLYRQARIELAGLETP